MGDAKQPITPDELLELFVKRDQGYEAATNHILERLGPTVLAALYDFFDVSFERVEWMGAQMFGSILIIFATVTHKANEISPILEHLAPREETDIESVERVVKVGIPVSMVAYPKERILDFLRAHIHPEEEPPKPEVEKGIPIEDTNEEDTSVPINSPSSATVGGFDTEGLSKEQIRQLLFRQREMKETKH